NLGATQERLTETRFAQPALFVVEYALARLWMKWGIRPTAMLGHSVGEYVAATLAGVFGIEDALAIIAERGRLVQQSPRGAMLAVALCEAEIHAKLDGELDIAAVNDSDSCVVSGPIDAIEDVEQKLRAERVACQRLRTSHAFHSSTMDALLNDFGRYVASKPAAAPNIPYILNVNGEWADPMVAPTPAYWVRHLRGAVRFTDGLRLVLQQGPAILMEVGPGQTLSRLARRHTSITADHIVLASQPEAGSPLSGWEFLLKSLGELWLYGAKVDWEGFHDPEKPRRVRLPSYPFERRSHWIEKRKIAAEPELQASRGRLDIADWCLVPYWKPTPIPIPAVPNSSPGASLLFADSCGLAQTVAEHLRATGERCATVEAGERFQQVDADHYRIDPRRPENYVRLLRKLLDSGLFPERILHLWNVTDLDLQEFSLERFERAQCYALHSLLYLAQAIGHAFTGEEIRIAVISSAMQTVMGGDGLYPEKATIAGVCRVIPQEYANISCRSIDVVFKVGDGLDRLATAVIEEARSPAKETAVAYRRGLRWVQAYQRMHLPSHENAPVLRTSGCYLITGGLGGIGLTLASYVARSLRRKWSS
ncbi:MAG: acyltransferase domain-containing protein, partial [Acidobacteriales bacterium]|nr:acyltransferase domain-containing protein [Terriglobales bacterium]